MIQHRGKNMLDKILIFRIDKELKDVIAKLKAKHYNISSLVRAILKRELNKIAKKKLGETTDA